VGASLDLRVEGNLAVLAAHGEFDIVTAGSLADALRDACAAGLSVVLDLREVSFLDASALRCFASARGQFAESGCSLTVVNVPRLVARMFELTGLSDLIAV
jgi:anti-sigma B factor antagonist